MTQQGVAGTRNTQLDGLRAFAVLGVMVHHWVPASWRGPLPFEIGLFFFLTLTGFLITRILLRDRAAGEAGGQRWRVGGFFQFEKRRMLRILIPCYAAMLFALLVGASDIRHHPFAYFGHWSNFHMAWMHGWPSGTAHYWTLAIQMQFYLLWPLVVFLTPRRWLTAAFVACVIVAPLARMILAWCFPEIHHPEAITLTALDYFGCGALLALAMERGMKVDDSRLKLAASLAFGGYAFLYIFQACKHPLPGLGYVQQTLLAGAFTGLISRTLAGFGGALGRILDSPAVQHVGKLSFGLYLFHTPVPLFLGWVCPWLWGAWFVGYWQIIRLIIFALTSWGLAYLCWKHLESRAMKETLVCGHPKGRR
jgi:peptidoglycan/LPS O-acetylase OafA/YrhL